MLSESEAALRSEIAVLLQEREALEHKVMRYVDRNANLRDSIVRMRERVRHYRERVAGLEADVRAAEQRELVLVAELRGTISGMQAALRVSLERP